MFKKLNSIFLIFLLPFSFYLFQERVNALDSKISILLPGQEFNQYVINAEEIVFTSYSIPSDFLLTAIDVSASDSVYKSYLYIIDDTYYISPQFDGVSIYSNPDSSFMFSGCQNLISINFDNFNTSLVTDMRDMFELCSSLERLDLSVFDTLNVEYMQYMFYSCSNLYSLNIDSFNLDSLLDMTDMFGLCPYLKHYNYDTSTYLNQDLTLIGTDWTWLKTEQIGSTGDGTVWLRVYAKLDSQDFDSRTSTVSYKSTLFYKKSSSYSFYANSGTYKYLNGTGSTPIVKVSANGTYKGGETVLSTSTGIVTHDENGEATITVSARFISSPWGWDTTNTVTAAVPDLDPISKFNVTLDVYPFLGGTVSGGGQYLEGETAILTATPNYEFNFNSWSDGNTDNPREIVVNDDISLTANFVSTVSTPSIPVPDVIPPSYTSNDSYNNIILGSSNSKISGGSLSLIQVDHYNVYTVYQSSESDQFFDNRNDNFYTYQVSNDGVGHYIFLVYDYSEIFVHAPNMVVSQFGIQPVTLNYLDAANVSQSVVYPSGDGIIQSDVSEFYIKFTEDTLYKNYAFSELPFSNSSMNQNKLEWIGTKTNVFKANLDSQYASISINDSISPYSLIFMICDTTSSLDNAQLIQSEEKGNNLLSGISNYFNDLINGNDKSNSIVEIQSSFNNQVRDKFNSLDKIEESYINDFNDSLSDIHLNNFNISSFGSDFIPTANFVSTVFDSLTDNYFGIAIGFSLVVGFALLLFGKRL